MGHSQAYCVAPGGGDGHPIARGAGRGGGGGWGGTPAWCDHPELSTGEPGPIQGSSMSVPALCNWCSQPRRCFRQSQPSHPMGG